MTTAKSSNHPRVTVGRATVTAGTVTVVAPHCTALSTVILTPQAAPGAATSITFEAIPAAGQFVINALVAAGTVNNAENAWTFNWMLIDDPVQAA